MLSTTYLLLAQSCNLGTCRGAGSDLLLNYSVSLLLLGNSEAGLLHNHVDVADLAELLSGAQWQVLVALHAIHVESSGNGGDLRGSAAGEFGVDAGSVGSSSLGSVGRGGLLATTNWALLGGRHR